MLLVSSRVFRVVSSFPRFSSTFSRVFFFFLSTIGAGGGGDYLE